MANHEHEGEFGCRCGCNRRSFLTASATATGALAMNWLSPFTQNAMALQDSPTPRKKAVVRAVFLYPPAKSFAEKPDAWWGWPGNEFDAAAHQKKYTLAIAKMEKELGMKIDVDDEPIADRTDAARLAKELQTDSPDGLLLIVFHDKSLAAADALLKVAAKADIPSVLYVGLGMSGGKVTGFSRPGVYFIQSMDNVEAVEAGMRMINAKKRMSQTRLLSIADTKTSREVTEPFFGITVQILPVDRYTELAAKMPLNDSARQFIGQVTRFAKKSRTINRQAMENAARAHSAVTQLLKDEKADGLAINCPRLGLFKPCLSFATLNSQLIPAACENDLAALCTQLLGQLLTGRPGFQHNPAVDTEKNLYYASHCTCPPNMHGPEGKQLPYVLRRYPHANEGSCAIQVFWKTRDPVTMAHYYPGKKPSLDVYSGRVVISHPSPPATGCATNVQVEITDRAEADMVKGHHNILFCGDFARRFRMFAQMHKLPLTDID